MEVRIEARLLPAELATGNELFVDFLFDALREIAKKRGLGLESLSVRVGQQGSESNTPNHASRESCRTFQQGISALY